MTETYTKARDQFLQYVRDQLVGPFGDGDELITDPPNRRYLMGVLFPRSVAAETYIEEEGEQRELSTGVSSGEESLFSDSSVVAANDFLPASQGLSFFSSARRLRVRVDAARYETLQGAAADAAEEASGAALPDPTERPEQDPRRPKRRVWRRHPLPTADEVITGSVEGAEILDGRAQLHVRWRPVANGALITATVVNAETAPDDSRIDRLWDQMLLQVAIQVEVDGDGEILEYPSVSMLSHDLEEDELRLQHRDARTYAIGHGCAPTWPDQTPLRHISSEVMPAHEVAKVSAKPKAEPDGTIRPRRALDIAWLADRSVTKQDLHTELNSFINEYRHWAGEGNSAAEKLSHPRQRSAAQRIMERIDTAIQRMTRGADLLVRDDHALLAFRLANEAMLRQMRHSNRDLAGSRRSRAAATELPDSYAPGAQWRPFQLGFALLTLTGLADEQDPDNERDIVDLIWFPTGGGKTEAYLLMAAFEIFQRRLRHGRRGVGTTVISRYTLTLLSTQQFQRAATTICACERIRAENPDLLGDTPVSIGLWVGGDMTPNHYQHAREAVEELKELERPDDRLVLERCPWCGTEILPRSRSEDLGDYGVEATDTSFRFWCTNAACDFRIGLPVHVVDDDLYEHPPTFVLGTVDKFAALAWEPRSGALFGRSNGTLPPSLIIQDELHLLTGPLGTTVGLYESAIELLCERDGRLPKVISSTATIRRASDQVKGLFSRHVELFPPSGLSADDSHFARADTTEPGRLYVGLMAQGHTSDTATVHTVAALMQAPVDLDLPEQVRDAYWTLIAYHSSLRELGRTVTMARDDVPSRLTALVKGRPVRQFGVEEITSNVDATQRPDLLERLNRSFHERNHLEFVASTNMLSVGVDVPRLGLMMVNGQPKATAEYIQATSRVGRDKHPGLVFSLFRSTRPRDRSHYENFVPYHSALYRFVEPTSVTPWSPPSRERALHALLVILVRHHLGLAGDGKAGEIVDHRDAVDNYIEQIVAVAQRVEPREAAKARTELQRFRDDWLRRAAEAARENKLLYYSDNGKGQFNLICDFHQNSGWKTPRSMRNVDRESSIDVLKAGTSTTKPRRP
ncbi:helicase [Actinoplanes sp. TBRC 11911]|uniref:helicase-related protein n=1 Tax=Actinoplanes sp. TBRC 11911 TaxID=2729386 RepID=UPI00145F48D6|nr:helicase-related protein [Actinoplanes sp. TBRC 11911]NMO53848.1 helicase [Actinoplanes sp. TBRC 11911]